jgi:hypothetical protein
MPRYVIGLFLQTHGPVVCFLLDPFRASTLILQVPEMGRLLSVAEYVEIVTHDRVPACAAAA